MTTDIVHENKMIFIYCPMGYEQVKCSKLIQTNVEIGSFKIFVFWIIEKHIWVHDIGTIKPIYNINGRVFMWATPKLLFTFILINHIQCYDLLDDYLLV